MKSLKVAMCPGVAGLLLAAGTGFAQVSEEGMGKVLPVELYTCTYVEGKGSADLSKVVERWSSFADDSDMDDYAAWLLTPFFFGTEQAFDVIWLGAFRDGNAMGKGLQNWITNGQDISAAFGEVVNCDAHLAFASAMYKAPEDNNPPDMGFITMMDCALNEGQKYTDIKAAELKWAAHLDKSGSKVAYYHWMPMWGGGDAEFDYKVVFSYPNFEEIGADFERIANDGGREASEEIFGDIDECDDARVYTAKSIRSAKIRD